MNSHELFGAAGKIGRNKTLKDLSWLAGGLSCLDILFNRSPDVPSGSVTNTVG